MDKTLILKTYVDGVNDTPFPQGAEEPIEIGSFRYDAKRMGGAPTITASINHPTCLDDVWTDMVYTELNGEKYFLKQTPTSSKSNEDARYRHDLILVAERVILDNTYFFDAVVGRPVENDVPVTNSTKFNFYGDIVTFVRRMNASLQYTGIQKVDESGKVVSGYHVVLDNDVTNRDQKPISFDSAVFSQALQESYNTFGVPFYFDGKTIHVGFSNNIIDEVLEYGVDGALLSATKTNANFKVVNRATGNGSSDNIPYYYPNESSKGEIEAQVSTSSQDFSATLFDPDLFAGKVAIDGQLNYVENYLPSYDTPSLETREAFSFSSKQERKVSEFNFGIKDIDTNRQKRIYVRPIVDIQLFKELWSSEGDGETANTWQDWVEQPLSKLDARIIITINDKEVYNEKFSESITETANLLLDKHGGQFIKVKVSLVVNQELFEGEGHFYYENLLYKGDIGLSYNFLFPEENNSSWFYEDKKIDLEDVGIKSSGTPMNGDTITQKLIKRINTSDTLQPSIYRATDGKERFYNAINYPFDYEEGYELKYGEYIHSGKVHNDAYKKDDGTYYEFTNEYKEGRPREHVFSVDDIKPTIKEMTNNISWVEQDEEGNNKTVFQRIDMFSEFAYNIGDNDETYIDPNNNTSFKHPYFFAKLRKLDFNLFDSASELGEMTFSMTSGHCGACNFKIGVSDDYPQFNTVQVDENGNLVYDENGYVLCGLEDVQGKVEPQDRQQDTVNYEVWIALKKEEDTYGILMPKAPKYEGNTLVDAWHRPTACSSPTANDGDTFVILNINLPDEYVCRAEKKLEKAIVKYIWENNVEKFNFSVNFSRIFLEENSGEDGVATRLNENARLTNVRYNGKEYILYVSSYSYTMNEGEALPEIRVELDDTLTISQNALQNAINEVKNDIANAINAIDVAAIGSRYFLRKDTYDVAEAPIDFRGGVLFGDGGEVSYLEDGSARLSIDFLDVRKKATFTSLEIQEQSHVGGQILVTPASMVCNKVEELTDSYRCYFESYGEDGEEIFNQFVEGDQAISQTFNAWGGHYYWRLVTSAGNNYIDLSKTDCATESDIPKAGDKIIQLGHRSDVTRQAAQVISSHGEASPSFIMYNGIDSFSLTGKEITGVAWNPLTQEPQMYSYGSFFFGDGTKDKDGKLNGNFITFQKKTGENEKTLTINADVQLGGGSTGLSNLNEWKQQETKIKETSKKVDGFESAIEETSNKVAGFESDIEEASRKAEEASRKAEEAIDNFNDLVYDDMITPSEKQALKIELINVDADYEELYEQYSKYILDFDELILDDGGKYVTEEGFEFRLRGAEANWEEFAEAYNNYREDLSTKIATAGSVAVGQLQEYQSDYYASRTVITEDIALAIKSVSDYSKRTANEALDEVKDVTDTIEGLESSIKASLEDTIIDEAEKATLKQYLDTLEVEQSEMAAAYQVVYKNPLLIDNTTKRKLYNTYTTITSVIDELKNAINELITEDATEEEKTLVYENLEAYKYHYNNYKEALEAARKSIEDNINGKAESAKDVTDALNDDEVFTKIEKRDVRRIIAEITECQGALIPYNATITRTAVSGNPWYLVNEKSVAEWTNINGKKFSVSQAAWAGYYSSDMHEKSGKSTTQLNISLLKDFSLKLEFGSDGEEDYDYLRVGNLDKQITEGNFLTQTMDKHGINNVQRRDFQLSIEENKSSYFIQLQYLKDGSGDIGTDSGYYRLLNASYMRDNVEYISELKGSFHERFFVLNSNGYYNKADELKGRLENVMSYLNQYALWEDEDTKVESTFRDTLNNLLNEYYSYISELDFTFPMERLNDSEYLKEAFGNAKSMDVEGVVMSQMMAVRNDEGEVEAFLNGSDFANDGTHGKMILAGGIPESILENDKVITDLEKRAKEAKTKIYEDGTIYAYKGIFAGDVKMGFQEIASGKSHTLNIDDSSSIYMPVSGSPTPTTLILPTDPAFDGLILNVFAYPRMTKNEAASCITGHILCPMLGTTGYTYCSELTFEKGGIVQLIYFAKKNEWILMSAQENILIVTQEP